MRYGSVCAGIEAASVAWEPLGWQPAFFSEIDAFPRAVLAERFPGVPIHGDFTTINEGDYEAIDLLVGGTPCQDFSVAGLRAGLAGDRGGLTIEFAQLARRLRPRWLVWENVPGILSIDGGEALRMFLDILEELGYVLDIDILDAQFHGVPQRRRRLFVCGQHRDDLIAQKTDSSALTIAQCWLEILHGIFLDLLPEFVSEQQSLVFPSLSKDGIARRMKLFGFLGETENSCPLRENLVDALARCPGEQNDSDVARGANAKGRIQVGRLMASKTALPSSLTAESLRISLDASCEVMKSYITSTVTNETMSQQICTCSQAVLHIALLIVRLNHSSPCFWNAASSALMALEEFTNYARWTSGSLFGDMERRSAWRDFIGQAERTSDALGCVAIRNFGKILPLSESLRGDSPPRREAGEGIARPLAGCAEGGSGYRNDADTADNLIAFGGNRQSGALDVATACNAHGGSGRLDFESETFVTHSLRADGFDASEDGTGRGTPLTLAIRGRGDGYDLEYRDDSISNAILTPNGGRAGIGVGAVAFSAMQSGMIVRRLTPRECERLQGFPDDFTAITYRGKLAADGPRYRALGNSMAVPCMRWIGERISMVEAMR